ncbi:hypothetical protein [Phytoactinopolyspora endophytica]|uniref:hypothetical protein n=1 Tax=Phytoactinopolyspora endophytica TaxID=1642495 RepID=UPI00101BC5D1|nr:hypothetical protein [Phytoactinopolyspora endophytica]
MSGATEEPAGGTEERTRGVDRMTWRVLRTELMRGTAPVAALSIAVAGGAMLLNETERWAGRWGPLAEYTSVVLFALLPFAATAGAWQVGREHRRRIVELLGSTARPPAHQVLLAWCSVTLGALAGLAVAWAPGAVLVARVATYGGKGWWWTLAVAFVGLAAASAVGVAAGRWISSRVVAPTVGLVVFAGVGVVSASSGTAWSWLTPGIDWPSNGVEYLETDAQLLQLVWLAGLTATLLMLAAARRKWPAVVPAAVAVVAAMPLVSGPADRWAPDPAARELVCTDDGGAELCMTRVNAFLLDDAKGPVREQLARWEEIDGGFVRAVDSISTRGDDVDDAAATEGAAATDGAAGARDATSSSIPEDTAVVDLSALISWNGGLSEENEYGENLATVFAQAADDVVYRRCDPYDDADGEVDGHGPSPEKEPMLWASGVAYHWVLDDPSPAGTVVEDGEQADFQVLLAKPEAEQKEWMSRYMAAARTCDTDAFATLMEELQ